MEGEKTHSLVIQRLADHTGGRADEQHRQAASNRYQSDQTIDWVTS
jgi:hypothetical protein